MKDTLRAIFSPILNVFESGEEAFSYEPSHRTILLAMSSLFVLLAGLVVLFAHGSESLGYLIPVVVFGCVGFVGFVVAGLGTDRAVAKIWGNK